MAAHLKKMRGWSNAKAWFQYIDLDTCLSTIFESDNAYIVDDAYMVVYEIVTPWYAKDEIKFLEEVIVLRLVRGGDFSNVSAFMRGRAREAGAKLVCTGTALARYDASLASFYHKLGYRTETAILVTEP
jgi:hypothetical protein